MLRIASQWLLAACVAAGLLSVRAGPLNGQCGSVMRGVETNNMLALPVRVINPGDRIAEIIIPNNCATGMYGQRVAACDADAAPALLAPPWPAASPAAARRRGALLSPAYVFVYQYCSPL